MTWMLIGSGIIAPALFWIGYFYYKDRYRPEPILKTGLGYVLGFAAAYLCFKGYPLLASVLGLPEDACLLMENNRALFFSYCLGVVGVVEEGFKFLPFVLVIVWFKDFDERIDGIFYAAVIALGFASYENLHYLPLLEGFPMIGRAIASPLTHTVFASIWGYYAGPAFLSFKLSKSATLAVSRWITWKTSIKGLLIASLLHGLFDFLTTSPSLRLVSALVILGIWLWQIRKMENWYREGPLTGAKN
jgi:RsiW-degrading membrane proteinase PrsW (M82 family)